MNRATLLTLLAILLFSPLHIAESRADIHAPPIGVQNIPRKLGRSISNLLFGITEIPNSIFRSNRRQGRTASLGYGVVDGVTRGLVRTSSGALELVTFALPINKDSYRQMLRDGRIYPYCGYTEFAPEIGVSSTRHKYTTHW